ncbi:MAG: winged helix-turn-helix transcriptional regulator [Candidatus Heimdallarchaeota archaeon]|nr:winged helix-turn-helix transcriptional regulator [Candidatus Heimdallarchaeota archaeon]MCK4770354.1 winged helix-turn-helix transcriptional regulator [Candidatus Heimdallarchaeota archaeon]
MNSESKQEETEKKDLNIIKLKKGETVNISKALGSSKRLSILQFLSKEELNLSEIADKIESTPQAVYHHLQILEKSKLVQIVREEKIKNMTKTIKYYRATYEPDAINLILWAPLDIIEPTELESRVPIQERPVERIVKKMADKVFKDLTDAKIEVLTSVVKGLVDLSHESMNSLRKDYGLELDEKLWNLILLFSNLSVMNAVKKFSEIDEYRKKMEDLVSLLYEEYQEL